MRFLGIIIGILLLVGIALTGSFLWDAYALSPDDAAPDLQITIPQGTSVDAIAVQLEDAGIITSRFYFKAYVKLAGAASLLQAGEFVLKPKTSFRAAVQKLSRAEFKEVQVTIPEGFTSAQIGAAIDAALEHVTAESWDAVARQPSALEVAQKLFAGIPSGQGLEGYLFPDTYRFRVDADAKTVAETMALTLSRRLAENNIIVPDHLVMPNEMTLHELLTLASIVEREVRSPEDMARVAGIFFSRLKIGMALQADSTVNYVTGKKDAAVTFADSRIESPYNTYIKLGLPPGPICNPGMNAIRAVLNPVDSDALYFLTTSEGEVVYARTFEEHMRNKKKWLE